MVRENHGDTDPSQEDTNRPGYYQTMDYGPVIAESIRQNWPEGALVRKGLAIRVDNDAAMIFDTDLLRFAAGTVGGWLDITNTDYASFKGEDIPRIEGRQVFASSEIAGWAQDGSFNAPREEGMGPLPDEWGRYKGYYRYGDQVVLSYTVGETGVLELPGAITHGDSTSTGFVRTMRIEASDRPMQALLFEKLPAWSVIHTGNSREMIFETAEGALGIRLVDGPENVKLVEDEGLLKLHVPSSGNSRTIRVMIFEMNAPDDPLFEEFPREVETRPVPDLREWVQGGDANWDTEIEVSGKPGDGDSAYVMDRIGIPFDNPWGSWMRLTGLDFFEDGTRAAVSTWNGDVWIVSGIDESLENIRWRRFASGLFYPMGIAVVDGQIHVTERSQLTRLHDLNGNGEADFYENLNNDGIVHPKAHSLGLVVDSEGYFYFLKNGNRVPGEVPLHGALVRVSPDGAKREIYARGFRGVNSIGIDPDDRILTADQQGNWVPVERIDFVKRGGFHGYRPHGGDSLKVGEFETPVAWIPRSINNSSGSMTFAGDSRWGPLAGSWILGSYGQGTLLAILTEEMDGQWQGGAVALPLETNTGLMRGRMNPADGQLYVIGMSGWGRTSWDAETIDDGSFLRIRYTGRNANLPVGLETTPEGIGIEFTDPLNPESAGDVSNYTARRWEYIYSEQYGSPEMSFMNADEEGRDPVAISNVTLSDDNRRIFLDIPDLRSVMQMEIEYELLFDDGKKDSRAVYFTVNWVSEEEAGTIPRWQQRIIEGHGETGRIAEQQDDEPVFDEDDQPEWYQQGELTFRSHCASCHVGGAIAPSLNESDWIEDSHEALVRILLQGKRGDRGIMAPFPWMEDGQIASLVSYIRMRWDDDKEPISASEVERIRQYTRERTSLWTEEELRELK